MTRMQPYDVLTVSDFPLSELSEAPNGRVYPQDANGDDYDISGYAWPVAEVNFETRNNASYEIFARDTPDADKALLRNRPLPELRAPVTVTPTEEGAHARGAKILASHIDPTDAASRPLRWFNSSAFEPVRTAGSPFFDTISIPDLDEDIEVIAYFNSWFHSADYWNEAGLDYGHDNIIDSGELDRVITLYYAASGIACAGPNTESDDGYTAFGMDTNQWIYRGCAIHSLDYNPNNWKISLSELLRLIQFYNYRISAETDFSYFYCPEQRTEDGYCLGDPL